MNSEEIKKQHENNYRNAVLENITNNTDVLVNQDILSLLKKPPLDSMDFLRTKFIDLARKNKIVLNSDKLTNLLDQYRKSLVCCCSEIKEYRIQELTSIIEKTKLDPKENVFKLNKKDFAIINKKIHKIIKECIMNSFDKVSPLIDTLFDENTESNIKSSILEEFTKYIKNNYQKQLLDSVEIKILVKDTTLINTIKEEGERYLFTLENSRLLHDL